MTAVSECDAIQGRAAALCELVSRHIGTSGSCVSAFDGAVQDTDTEIDLWEGIDAVVMCAGRGSGEEGIGRRGGGTTDRAGGMAGGCEALVRFVSHKCVLHGKPLVWGWAGSGGEGGAGVEVSKEKNRKHSVREGKGSLRGVYHFVGAPS